MTPIRAIVLAFLGVAGLTCVGCGPSGPKLHPVRGTVTVQGKPAHHAIVFLHRTGRKDMTEPVPFGKVDEKGEYVISSSAGTEGAQEGEYVVTIYWPDMSKPEDGNGQRPDALNGAYDKPAQSKFTASVKPGPNVLPKMDLTPAAPKRAPAPNPNDK